MLTLKTLPAAPADYAQAWYHQSGQTDMASAVSQYNAYLQTLADMQSGAFTVAGVDLKQIGQQIQASALAEFRKKGIQTVAATDRNDYQKALYAYLVKRFMQSLSAGTFTGDGITGARPDVAAAIEAHVDQIFYDSSATTTS